MLRDRSLFKDVVLIFQFSPELQILKITTPLLTKKIEVLTTAAVYDVLYVNPC